jgi:RHS repeat-associated protein
MRISQRRTATSFYGYDAGGSVRQLTDNTGTVTDTYAYDAFGNTVAQTGSTVNEFQYRGEQYDASLQMYYLRARYYRPQTGTFLTQDTYEPADQILCSCRGDRRIIPQTGINHLFEYTQGDPVNYIDPGGKDSIIETIITNSKLPQQAKADLLAVALAAKVICATVTITRLVVTPFARRWPPIPDALSIFCAAITLGSLPVL